MTDAEPTDRLKDMRCPQCKKEFVLGFDEGKDTTLILRGCPSGGIYDVFVSCPHCDYEEPL